MDILIRPSYFAEITVIRCSGSIDKIHDPDLLRSTEHFFTRERPLSFARASIHQHSSASFTVISCRDYRYTLQRSHRQILRPRSFEKHRLSLSSNKNRYPLQKIALHWLRHLYFTVISCSFNRYTLQRPHRQNQRPRSFEIEYPPQISTSSFRSKIKKQDPLRWQDRLRRQDRKWFM